MLTGCFFENEDINDDKNNDEIKEQESINSKDIQNENRNSK